MIKKRHKTRAKKKGETNDDKKQNKKGENTIKY
jgi:hypothetical protein